MTYKIKIDKQMENNATLHGSSLNPSNVQVGFAQRSLRFESLELMS